MALFKKSSTLTPAVSASPGPASGSASAPASAPNSADRPHLDPMAPAAPPKQKPKADDGGYDIDDAIALVSDLPVEDEEELVISVVTQTLRSRRIAVSEIIASGEEKERLISNQIKAVQAEIGAFEEEIRKRRREVATLQDSFEETRRVRELLTKGAGKEPAAVDHDDEVADGDDWIPPTRVSSPF